MKRVFGKLSKLKGSILAYTLILLGIVLTASMGMFMSSMRDLRSVGTQNRSMQAFQIANSGSEMAISAIKKNPTDLDDLATKMGGATCNAGEIIKGTPTSPYLGGETRLSFFDDAGTKIISCSEDVFKIASVKSVGTFKETARAVEVAVAAGCSNPGEVVTVRWKDSRSFDINDLNKIGDFLNDKRNRLVGFRCDQGNKASYTARSAAVSASGLSMGIDGGAGLSCFPASTWCELSGGSCVDGWAVYGMCTNDLP